MPFRPVSIQILPDSTSILTPYSREDSRIRVSKIDRLTHDPQGLYLSINESEDDESSQFDALTFPADDAYLFEHATPRADSLTLPISTPLQNSKTTDKLLRTNNISKASPKASEKLVRDSNNDEHRGRDCTTKHITWNGTCDRRRLGGPGMDEGTGKGSAYGESQAQQFAVSLKEIRGNDQMSHSQKMEALIRMRDNVIRPRRETPATEEEDDDDDQLMGSLGTLISCKKEIQR